MFGILRLSRAVDDSVVSTPVFVKLPLADESEVWQARCSLLKDDFNKSRLFLYSGHGGSGCSSNKTIASRKAICEVLERWAFWHSRENLNLRVKYGFDINDSTDGMAAFPELNCNQVQKKSFFEAVERWSISAWWNGLLPNSNVTVDKFGVHRISILSPFELPCLVIWKDFGDRRCYGFSCDESFSNAHFRALVELSRNHYVIGRCKEQSLPPVASLLEKRFVYFSLPDGRNLFDERVNSSCGIPRSCDMPSRVLSLEVTGDWSRYVKVWRTVYREDDRWDDKSRVDVFRF